MRSVEDHTGFLPLTLGVVRFRIGGDPAGAVCLLIPNFHVPECKASAPDI